MWNKYCHNQRNQKIKTQTLLKLFISVFITLTVGFIGSLFTVPAIPVWYAGLEKPILTPPARVFGPVWTLLYIFMGFAVFLIWKKHSNILQNVRMFLVWKWSIVLFLIQLVLNVMWSIIFFGLHSLLWALVDIIALFFAIAWTMFLFNKISKVAAYLLIPYLLWVGFAAYLNYMIVVLN